MTKRPEWGADMDKCLRCLNPRWIHETEPEKCKRYDYGSRREIICEGYFEPPALPSPAPAPKDGMSPDDVPDLYQLAYAPGLFRCPKCDFRLSKRTLNMELAAIGTTPENRQSEGCPNDGTMMVHVTYKEMVAGYEKRLKQELDDNDRLRAAARPHPERLREALRWALSELPPGRDGSPYATKLAEACAAIAETSK